ncbi:MAG: translation elongation factor Ts [Bacteroidetes bacterium RIFOXYA12_FULL_35_11]|nr:MAG: translation elongation factor Ts [Bacteroidetes bacterium GWF2_35_48]OFY75985.1 MAG: translation elongation factor Ts [Bacteroidetes bacterium RIFOXYA12_FULL_35_11]OFY94892.1 MAG: translation elongation factor Ts [Bacteroidetes bacterium RIFOXYC12_FULL_35_7]OFY95671.1 MAG: translation elongation factor Ts [Bacteroidetes bacterium RIFOXYB2_FULL_35_7]HBX53691.1 elongation factor Ts [Bacteroidales bacterium]
MYQVSATDVSKLRKITSAGMMDCKKALEEANGDIEEAVQIVRKKGLAIANKRSDREASEGAVLSKVTPDAKRGAVIVLNCETDFVAKNENFVGFAYKVLDLALENNPANLDELKQLKLDGRTVEELVVEQSANTGEKVDLSGYEKIEAAMVTPYIHPGNKVGTLVGFSVTADIQVGKDVAMQIAAMAPVALDKDDVSQKILDQEMEIGREQATKEGKPADMIEKIALGKLNKFYKESTLLNQEFVKDNKKTIREYLQSINKELTVTAFKRFSLKG